MESLRPFELVIPQVTSVVDSFFYEKEVNLSLVEETVNLLPDHPIILLLLATCPNVTIEALEFLQSYPLEFDESLSEDQYLSFINERKTQILSGNKLKALHTVRKILGPIPARNHPGDIRIVVGADQFAKNFEDLYLIALAELALLHPECLEEVLKDDYCLKFYLGLILGHQEGLRLAIISKDDINFVRKHRSLIDGCFQLLLKRQEFHPIWKYEYTPRRYFINLAKEVFQFENDFYREHYESLQEFTSEVIKRAGDKRIVQDLIISYGDKKNDPKIKEELLNCPFLQYKDVVRLFSNYKLEGSVFPSFRRWKEQDWIQFLDNPNIDESLKERTHHFLFGETSYVTAQRKVLNSLASGPLSVIDKKTSPGVFQQTFNEGRYLASLTKSESLNKFKLWFYLKIEPNLRQKGAMANLMSRDIELPLSMESKRLKFLSSFLMDFPNSNKDLIKAVEEKRNCLRKKFLALNDPKLRLRGIF